ncbi:Acetate CoA-transferase YdiF [Candidatus Hydrogenisulfobacillus filiaventi]|uniref:Acetate CoA-transferase YdiF n=1 Tax=Candidatus Hydrogenisulfobacillus filiaventi TaxID=2707344 RepID=A0A6F8ZJH9_9FIRM|nr:acyl CoA:acetate/3-ketoacid CoA transferase [Bacillota bacterium]CAB1129895.1 Acetate CoA-transferase YdiF [Candidatus Hydrogenisulfobacillus filiaventi]
MRMLEPGQGEALAALIPDGATVAVAGNGSLLLAEEALAGIERAFLASGHPRDLTLYYPVLSGTRAGTGIDHLAHPGLVRAVVTSTFNIWDIHLMADLVREDRIEAHCLPMGIAFQLLRAAAAGQPGILTRIGLDTFLDPGAGGGTAFNRVPPTRTWVSRTRIDDQTYLFFRSPPVDVAILRAWAADPDGNLSLEGEPIRQAALDMALAARARRGRVLAQVRYVVRRGSLPPRRIDVPGFLVDAVLPSPGQPQSLAADYDPALTGEWAVEPPARPVPLSPRKVMARRVALLLSPGRLVNLGFGVPTLVAEVLAEEGVANALTFSVEHGPVGGQPTGKETFGASVGPRFLFTAADVFTLYHGQQLDWAILSAAEVDAAGHANVHRFATALPGPGGFIDITASARRVVFATALTTGGTRLRLKTPPEAGLEVEQEGRIPKFVPRLAERTFSAREALRRGAEVWYVTDRATFRLTPDGLVLTEVAPGIDPARDVIARMGFRPRIDPGLRPWPQEVFRPGLLGLAARWAHS